MSRVMSEVVNNMGMEPKLIRLVINYLNLAALSRPQSCKGLRKISSSPLVSTIHIVSSIIAVDSKLLSVCFAEGCFGDCEKYR